MNILKKTIKEWILEAFSEPLMSVIRKEVYAEVYKKMKREIRASYWQSITKWNNEALVSFEKTENLDSHQRETLERYINYVGSFISKRKQNKLLENKSNESQQQDLGML